MAAITQAILATAFYSDGGGSPPLTPTDYFGQQWLYTGRNDSPTLAPSGTYTVYTQSTNINNVTFGDGSSGTVANFNNGSWTSADLNNSGLMTSTYSIAIDIWFYPTANGVQLLSEWGGTASPGWHATVLEINANNTISSRLWSGTTVTSSDTVTLNAWNHVWLCYNHNNTSLSLRVNNGTVMTAVSYSRASNYVSGGQVAFNIGEYDITYVANTGRFAGDLGELRINNWAAPSSYWSGAKKYLNLGGTPVTDGNLKFNLQGTTAPSGSYWNDSSVNGYNAILNGSIVYDGSTGYYTFGGSNYGEIGDPGNEFGTAGTSPAQTMSMWINMAQNTSNYQAVAGIRENGTYDFYLLILYAGGNNTEFRVRTSATSTDNLVDYAPLFDKWTHVTCIAESTQTRIYFNSKLAGIVGISGSFGNITGTPFYLTHPSYNGGSSVKMAEIQFYNRVLTQAEIERNYATNKLRLSL